MKSDYACLDLLSRETSAKRSVGAKAFFLLIDLTHTP